MNSTPLAYRSAGLVIAVLLILFLLLDGAMKLVQPKQVLEATDRLAFPRHALAPLGITLLIATVLYALPRTAVLGAVLLTGYLGGAVATHVRAGSGTFEMLFPAILGALIWLSLLLRDRRVGQLLPMRGV